MGKVVTEDRQLDQARRVIEEADAGLDHPEEGPLTPSVLGERARTFKHTGLSRMRTSWGPDEQLVMDEIRTRARMVVRHEFRAAFALMEEIHRLVRTPLVDKSTGEIMTNLDGSWRWEANEFGNPVEHWERLGDAQRDGLMHTIATHLYEMELKAVDMWGESMFAKGRWEEVFAHAFIAPEGRLTVDDRTQRGQDASMEARYLAIFKAVVSKQADAVIRSLTRIQGVLEKTARRL